MRREEGKSSPYGSPAYRGPCIRETIRLSQQLPEYTAEEHVELMRREHLRATTQHTIEPVGALAGPVGASGPGSSWGIPYALPETRTVPADLGPVSAEEWLASQGPQPE